MEEKGEESERMRLVNMFRDWDEGLDGKGRWARAQELVSGENRAWSGENSGGGEPAQPANSYLLCIPV
jgi:hypothetical protein